MLNDILLYGTSPILYPYKTDYSRRRFRRPANIDYRRSNYGFTTLKRRDL